MKFILLILLLWSFHIVEAQKEKAGPKFIDRIGIETSHSIRSFRPKHIEYYHWEEYSVDKFYSPSLGLNFNLNGPGPKSGTEFVNLSISSGFSLLPMQIHKGMGPIYRYLPPSSPKIITNPNTFTSKILCTEVYLKLRYQMFIKGFMVGVSLGTSWLNVKAQSPQSTVITYVFKDSNGNDSTQSFTRIVPMDWPKAGISRLFNYEFMMGYGFHKMLCQANLGVNFMKEDRGYTAGMGMTWYFGKYKCQEKYFRQKKEKKPD